MNEELDSQRKEVERASGLILNNLLHRLPRLHMQGLLLRATQDSRTNNTHIFVLGRRRITPVDQPSAFAVRIGIRIAHFGTIGRN